MPTPHKIGVDDYMVKHGREAFSELPRMPFQPGLVWPSWVMAGAAGNFAMTYSQHLEASPAFLYMAYLTFLGHVLSDKITLASELKPQPRLFVVILGESADDRKSTAINVTSRFFANAIDKADLNSVFGVGSAEGLAKAFTPEMPQAILILDEFKALVQKCKIDGSVLLPCINTLFELNRFHSLTKNHDIKINDAQLCLLAASTLDTYENMFSAQFLDIGFLNRLFIVIGGAERKFSIPEPIPEEMKEGLRRDLWGILGFVKDLTAGGTYAMPLTPRARALFDDWYFGLEKSIFTKRLDTYGHRLMPLLAVNELKAEIDLSIARKVVALLNYQLEARRQADPIDADSTIAKLEEKIRRKLSRGPTRPSDLKKAVHYERVGVWAYERAMKNLAASQEVFFDKKSGLLHLKT